MHLASFCEITNYRVINQALKRLQDTLQGQIVNTFCRCPKVLNGPSFSPLITSSYLAGYLEDHLAGDLVVHVAGLTS